MLRPYSSKLPMYFIFRTNLKLSYVLIQLKGDSNLCFLCIYFEQVINVRHLKHTYITEKGETTYIRNYQSFSRFQYIQSLILKESNSKAYFGKLNMSYLKAKIKKKRNNLLNQNSNKWINENFSFKQKW